MDSDRGMTSREESMGGLLTALEALMTNKEFMLSPTESLTHASSSVPEHPETRLSLKPSGTLEKMTRAGNNASMTANGAAT